VIFTEEQYLRHYGTPRHSGRYPWGSGENPYQSSKSFLGMVADLKSQGMKDTEIAKALGMTTTELRARKSNSKNMIKQADIAMAQRLKDKGYSNGAIADRMGLSGESAVRALLAPGAMDKAKVLTSTSDMLKDQIAKKGIIDIGTGVEHHLVGVTETKLKNAVAMLEDQGYKVHYVKIQQLGTPHMTTVKVLTAPDVPYSEVYKNRFNIKQINDTYTEDGGRTWANIKPPEPIDSSRVAINYSEKNAKGEEIGGGLSDGVIFVRPGVDDVSLGGANYAQVRILVDGTHYLKGMAVYKNDLPPGVDLVYNVNKTKAEAPTKHDAMKKVKRDKRTGEVDPDNPFGATIAPGGQRGVMNVIYEEGTWDTWSRSLSSQMLSKQTPKLAKQQLDMMYERKAENLDEIQRLTHPAVKKHLLNAFAEDADSSAVHLKAAAMPRQSSNVLLPVQTLKPTEIYAPNHQNGDRVVLIRHPHGGVFEIPELTVNNKNREAQRMIGKQAPDAVGINPKVAQQLSGADFDGDTVLVIRNNDGKIRTAAPLEKLKDFDPQRAYPGYEGMPELKNSRKQQLMGDVSNLITDMTIKKATPNEIAKAVKHSMVVIDAEKHNLNWKQSEIDNGIKALKTKYQGGPRRGASTIVSQRKTTDPVPERKQGYRVDPETGRKVFTETGATYVDPKTGKTVTRMVRVNRLAEVEDARTLSSGTPIEGVYADHSNKLKALANEARRQSVNTKTTPYSPSARAAYSNEVDTLRSKLNVALSNSPLERQAQIVANAQVALKRDADPGMDPDEVKKLKNQALAEARTRVGAGKTLVEITPKEWEAIQAGAVSNTMLNDILKNTDIEVVKQYTMPKSSPLMSDAKAARARGMANSGYTQAEIAEALGVSVSTINDVLK
jgi:predicted transcriptional regulator